MATSSYPVSVSWSWGWRIRTSFISFCLFPSGFTSRLESLALGWWIRKRNAGPKTLPYLLVPVAGPGNRDPGGSRHLPGPRTLSPGKDPGAHRRFHTRILRLLFYISCMISSLIIFILTGRPLPEIRKKEALSYLPFLLLLLIPYPFLFPFPHLRKALLCLDLSRASF